MKDPDFEAECRRKFEINCRLYAASPFHADKKKYVVRAYEIIDAFLDWRELQSL